MVACIYQPIFYPLRPPYPQTLLNYQLQRRLRAVLILLFRENELLFTDEHPGLSACIRREGIRG